ncbi:MAG: acetyl-CoA hydrolase/transferase family protein, partial [Bdellovibrionales bacterium]|nr:acetyl-CoA hydrolase/transferase family protein [Bdellovibrionales bacterium]
MKKASTVEEVIALIPSTTRIFLQGGCATPLSLVDGLVSAANRFKHSEIIHLHTSSSAGYADPKYKESFRVLNLFVGAQFRPLIDYDQVDYLPCFLSEMPQLFRKRIVAPEVSLIHVSPPDTHGYCSLGTSVDITKAAIEVSKLVIAQINPKMPRTHGDGFIHIDQIHAFVEVNDDIPELKPKPLTKIELAIGQHTSQLIENGSTLQVGIGSIPDAVLAALTNHQNLGLHTEMWSDGAIPLLEKGIINNTLKSIHPGKTVSAFVAGTKKLFDYIHDNPAVVLLDVAYVNNPRVIAKNRKVVSINSAVEIDLSGQVCADSIGTHVISGVGGQIDFIRGAALSDGGKPIIAMTSRTKNNQPRIVPVLKSGAGVVTTRAHVHHVVTEYGSVDLFGQSIAQRAKSLISIAHPDDREGLERQWHEAIGKTSRKMKPSSCT